MSNISEILSSSKKIVVKVGSNTISGSDGYIDKVALKAVIDQIMELIKANKQVVIVSSGARIAGVAALNKWSRMEDMNYKQALCAIGQVELMKEYSKCFGEYGRTVAQMLLTRDDFKNSNRSLSIRNTMFTLMDENVIPIVNENDTVCVEEMRIGDNDNLAALMANLWNADLMILLSDIDGVYDKNPKTNKDAKLIECITDIDETICNIESDEISEFGTGGMATKFEAAERVQKYGTSTILANGTKPNILKKLIEGTEKATIFLKKN